MIKDNTLNFWTQLKTILEQISDKFDAKWGGVTKRSIKPVKV